MPTQSLALSGVLLALCLAGSGEAQAQQLLIGDQCSLPGPVTDDRCTVLYHVADNPANNIVCLWNHDALVACEGRTRWGGGFEYVFNGGTSLEFRRHANWPTLHPWWPSNPSGVRQSGTLLKQQWVQTRYRASPDNACDITVPAGGDIQTALNQSWATTVCLGAGDHAIGATLTLRSGQTLRGAPGQAMPTLRPVPGAINLRLIAVGNASGVTIKGLRADWNGAQRPEYGILIFGSNDVLLDGVIVARSFIGVGVTGGSRDVELRDSLIEFAGDGIAQPGGAQPSMWINDSSDVRVMRSTMRNNGLGPQGDGEIACYNSPNVAVHASEFRDIGASGMYFVNCDRALLANNLVSRTGEWGLDIVNTGYSSGSDYGLFWRNTVEYTRHGAVVLKDSIQATFQGNVYRFNRQGPNASGSCNGINKQGNTSGLWVQGDTVSSGALSCND